MANRGANPRTARGGRTLTTSLLAALAACGGVRTDASTSADADFTAYRSYAWAQTATPSDPRGAPVGDRDLDRAVRTAVDELLAARRLRLGERGEADLLLGFALGVEERVQVNDPYFATYPAEKYELGHLVVDAVDAKTGERVWRGVAESRLRYTARSMGVSSPQFVPTGEERRWRIDHMVRAVFGRFPIR